MGVIAMQMSPTGLISEHWDQPGYTVRVRGTAYLWGSAGITHNLNFDKPLLLHIHNDPLGEEVAFGTRVAAGTKTSFGTLQPGECVSIPLQNLTGVFATCAFESTVECMVRH
jgi:hypothetical protein